jgi:hypothetical protein
MVGGGSAPSATDLERPVWIQVAAEGDWKGHSSGAFAFNANVFDEIVDNFRRHPSYRVGPDGVGMADVIAYDFHHASERDATDGEIPVSGAPAQAWAQELDVRMGPGGKAELWALTRYLEPARTYAREGRYKWTSVAVWPDAIDPVTGEKIGWYLSSIAFTNDPFIQGMEPIAARRGNLEAIAGAVELSIGPRTPDELVSALRSLFGLSEVAPLGEVLGAVAQLRAYALGGQPIPPGVDVTCLLGQLRAMLNLPTLTTPDLIFAEVDKLLRALSAEPQTVLSATNAQAAARGSKGLIAASAAREGKHMDELKEFLVLGAARLRLDTTEPETVKKRLLEAASGYQGAMDQVKALVTALGVEDPNAAAQRIAELIQSAAQLKAALPQLAALEEAQDSAEDESAENDVVAAMSAFRITPEAKSALLFMRTGGIAFKKGLAPEARELARKSREAAKAKFFETYPKTDQAHEHLTRSVATVPVTRPLGLQSETQTFVMSGGSIPFSALRRDPPIAPAGGPGAGAGGTVDLEAYPGRNVTEKAMAFCRSQPGGDKLSFNDLHARASDIVVAATQHRRLSA